jgi:Circularly permutated YpsA SLOG family
VIDKIVSGGQIGADRAALDVARELGLATGGWVPRGRRAKDGAIPRHYEGLVEMDSEAYERRTELNVCDADAALIFSFGLPIGGSAPSAGLAQSLGKTLLLVDMEC